MLLLQLVRDRLLRAPWARTKSRRLEEHFIALPSKLWLPSEIWQHVASFLPLSSQASLALSCRGIAFVLGSIAWQSLRENPEELLNLLKLLDYQLPRHLLCFRCQVYHTRSSRKFCNFKHNGRDTPLCYDLAFLRFSELQLAMRAVRLGPSYGQPISIKKLLKRERRTNPAYAYSLCTAIVNGNFLFRLDSSRLFQDKQDLDDNSRLKWDLGICGHYRLMVAKLCRQAFDNAFNGVDRAVVDCCSECFTEYEVTVRAETVRDYSLAFTRWSDLGDGIDPRSPQWQSSLTIGDRGWEITHDWQGTTSVRKRYELQDSGMP